jgi:hypothetical protein
MHAMAGSDRLSWLDRAIAMCFGVLIGATALYIAVHLIEAVWPVLLVILAVTAFITAGIVILRLRRSGW